MKEIWSNWIRGKHCIHPQICVGLLLLLSRVSRVWLCATLWIAAHQAPPSLGFSRQEHWSGLPFPSPMHESEKWKWSRSVVSDSYRPDGLQPTRVLCPWDFPGKSTGVGCRCLCGAHTWITLPGFPGSPSLVLGTVPWLVAVEERLDFSTEVWLTVRF